VPRGYSLSPDISEAVNDTWKKHKGLRSASMLVEKILTYVMKKPELLEEIIKS
jgi:hypothetical protein